MTRRRIIFAACLVMLLSVSIAVAQDGVQMTLYVSPDRLVIHIPSSAAGVVSLQGFEFQAQIGTQNRTYPLSAYPSFALPFRTIPTPVCFSLLRSGATTPMPQPCSSVPIFNQVLAPSDVFWYDSVVVALRPIVIAHEGVPVTVCPAGQSECSFTYGLTAPAPTPTPELFPFEMVDSNFELQSVVSDVPSVTFQHPEDWSLVTNAEAGNFITLMSADVGELTEQELAEFFYKPELRDALLSGESLIFITNRGQGAVEQFTSVDAEAIYESLGINPDDFDNEPLARIAAVLWDSDNALFGEFREFEQASTEVFDVVRLVGSYLPYDDEPTALDDTEIIESVYLLHEGSAEDSVVVALSLSRIDQRDYTLAALDAIMLSMEVVPATQG